MYYQDCNNKEYCVIFFEKYIEIDIIKIPDNEYDRGQLFFNISIYFSIEKTVVKYKDNIFHNEEELKTYFKSLNKRKLSL